MKHSVVLAAALLSSVVLAGHHHHHHGEAHKKLEHAINKSEHHPEHKHSKHEPHQAERPHPQAAVDRLKKVAEIRAVGKIVEKPVKPVEYLAKNEEHPISAKEITKRAAPQRIEEHGGAATSVDEEARRKAMAIAIGKKEHAHHPHHKEQERAKQAEEERAKLAAHEELQHAAETARRAKELREAAEREIEEQRKVLQEARRETERLRALERLGEKEERELRELERTGEAEAARIRALMEAAKRTEKHLLKEEAAHKHVSQRHVEEEVNPAVALAKIAAKGHEEEERHRHERHPAGPVIRKEASAEPHTHGERDLEKEQELAWEKAALSKRRHEKEKEQLAVQARQREEHERLEHVKREEREKQTQLERSKAGEVEAAKRHAKDLETERRELEKIRAFEERLEKRAEEEALKETARQEHIAQHPAEQFKHHEHPVKPTEEQRRKSFGEDFAAEIRARHEQVLGRKQHKKPTPSPHPHEAERLACHHKLEGLLRKAAERLCAGQATTEADYREFREALAKAFTDHKAALLFVHPYRHLSTHWRPESPRLDEGAQHVLCQLHRAWEQLTRIASSPHSTSDKQCPELMLNMYYSPLQSKERLPVGELLKVMDEEARPYCHCLRAEHEAKERLSKSLVTEDPKHIFHGSLSNETVLLRRSYKHLPINTALQVLSLAIVDDPRHLTFVQAERESAILGKRRFVGIVPEENVLRLLFEQNI